MSSCYQCLAPRTSLHVGIPLCVKCAPPAGIGKEKDAEILRNGEKIMRHVADTIASSTQTIKPSSYEDPIVPDDPRIFGHGPCSVSSPAAPSSQPVGKTLTVSEASCLRKGDIVEVQCLACKYWQRTRLLEDSNPTGWTTAVTSMGAACSYGTCFKTNKGVTRLFLRYIAGDGRLRTVT